MQKHLTIVAPNGKIVQRYSGNFTEDDIDALVSAQCDNTVIASEEEIGDSYYDFETNTFVSKPQQPEYEADFDYSTKQYVRKESLDAMKDRVWQVAKNVRQYKESSGFSFNNDVYDSDQVSQARIHSAVALNVPTVWITKSNKEVELSPSDMVALQQALAQHISRIHVEFQELRKQIYATKSFDELNTLLSSIQEHQYA